MSRKRYTSEQIIRMLREVEVGLSQASKLGQICRDLGDYGTNLLPLAT